MTGPTIIVLLGVLTSGPGLAAAQPPDEAEPEAELAPDATPDPEPTPDLETSAPASEPEPAAPEPEPSPDPPAAPAAAEITPPPPDEVPDVMDDRPVTEGDLRFTPGKGLAVRSADGDFGLTVGARVQALWTFEREDGADFAHDLTLRRTRLTVSGHAFDPAVRFSLQLGLSPADLGIRDNLDPERGTPLRSPVLDAYVELRHLNDLQLRIGQFKVPSNRQRVISSSKLQLVDRSIANSEFNLDRDVGVELRSGDLFGAELLAYRVGVFTGRGRDARGAGPLDLMYIGRVDVTPLGPFDDYSEADLERGPARLAFGVGAALVDHGRRDRGTRGNAPEDGGTTTNRLLFVDAMLKWEGLSVLAELMYRDGDREPGDAVDEMGVPLPVTAPRNGYGLNLQAGYVLPTLPLEIAARYAAVRNRSGSSLADGNEVTGGVSYYVAEHPLKIQLDYSHLWERDVSVADDRVRLQLQVSL